MDATDALMDERRVIERAVTASLAATLG